MNILRRGMCSLFPLGSNTYDLQAELLYVTLHFYDLTVSPILQFLSDFGWTTLNNWTVQQQKFTCMDYRYFTVQ